MGVKVDEWRTGSRPQFELDEHACDQRSAGSRMQQLEKSGGLNEIDKAAFQGCVHVAHALHAISSILPCPFLRTRTRTRRATAKGNKRDADLASALRRRAESS